MKLFGQLAEITKIIFRKAAKQVTIEPATQTVAGDKTITIPDMTTQVSQTLVLAEQAQTLTNKTVVAASNTITTAASGNLIATELNAALSELQSDIDTRATTSTLSTHTGASSGVHGVTGSVVGTTDSQTLTNKTLTSPVINSPTGITKSDVGLSNVDNTSDATKNSAPATLTNKTLSAFKYDLVSRTLSSNTFAAGTETTQDITSGSSPLNTITGGSDGMIKLVRNSTGSDIVITENSGADGFRTGTGSNLTLKANATLTLRYDGTAARWFVIGGAGSGGGLTPLIITGTPFGTPSSANAVSGYQYYTNHSTAFEIALPSSPSIGDMFEVIDYAGNWNSKPVTLNPANASHSINGAAANENFVLDVLGVWVQVVYVASNDWRIISPIDPALVTSSLSSSSSGSGEINLVASGSNSNTNWSTGNGITPATTSTAGDLPLSGISSTALKLVDSDSGSETTNYTAFSMSMPEALKQRKLKVEFWMRPGTGFTASDWSVSVFNASSVRVPLSTDSSSLTLLPNMTGKFTTTFDADSSASYTLRFSKLTSVGAGSQTLNLAGIVVGPGIQPQGAVVGEWQSYTPTIAGNGSKVTTTLTGKYRRVGESAEIKLYYVGNATAAGAGATPITFSIPSGLTGNGSALPANLNSSGNAAGTFNEYGIKTAATYSAEQGVYVTGSSTLGLLEVGSGSIYTQDDLNVARSVEIVLKAMVPISEWAGSGTVNLAQNDVEYAFTTGTWDADDSTTGYGPTGATISGALATTRLKTVTFQTPIQATDELSLEIQIAGAGDWLPMIGAFDHGVVNSAIQPIWFINGSAATDQAGVGISRVSGSTTQAKIFFGTAPSGYYNGAAWTKNSWATFTAGSRWRIKKSSGGQAVGFGAATDTQSGLLQPVTAMSGALATMHGHKKYSIDTAYTNGTPTISSATPSVSSLKLGTLIPYKMSDGTWRLKFNIIYNVASASRTTGQATISGVTFKNVTSGLQAISALNDSGAAAGAAYVTNNTGTVRFDHLTGTSSLYCYSGDCELESKPTWAD